MSVWMQLICVNWSSIHSVHCNIRLDKLIQQHFTLFSNELVYLTGTTALILISSDAQLHIFQVALCTIPVTTITERGDHHSGEILRFDSTHHSNRKVKWAST